jgi:serine phosphatase RsbU (regulator of sigma subunit)
LGEDRVREALQGAGPGAEAAGDQIVKAIQRHAADRPQFDDITLVCFARE